MIENAQATKFANEVVRPLAEEARGLLIRINAAKTTWFSGVNALFPNDAQETLNDGRAAEGVSVLTGADVNSFVGILLAMESASNSEIIQKPCVRSIP